MNELDASRFGKMLKAHVVRSTGIEPPKIHNLSRLAASTDLKFQKHHQLLLAEMNRFQIETRYAFSTTAIPNIEQLHAYQAQTEEVLQWLIKQF